ncbi:MAG: TIGR03118 family protein [Acidobacteria bacterium]|nr:TIGR03118 family protein [Acidobacteriota bacterium]
MPGLPAAASARARVAADDGAQNQIQSIQIPVIAPGSAYRQTNLISDVPGLSPVLDPLLVNPWGISLTASSPFWVANNGTSTTQLIRDPNGAGPVVLNPGLPTVTIPGGLPTGTVANPTSTDFVLPGPCAAAPCGANFLFASITGNITGWDPNAPAAGSTTAVIAASHPGHVYTGLAIANNGSGNFLYAADFANGRIDVFNNAFALQPVASFPFADPTIPTTPGNTFRPFNIQAIGGLWALQFGNGGNGGDVNTLYFTAGPGEEEHGLFGKLNPTTATATSLIQFSSDDFAISEGSGHIDITVTRAGDASGSATVNYNTFDESQPGHASQKSDYEIALGSLTFAPGETSKTFRVLLVNDRFVEGNEIIDLFLSNPTGAGVGLGSPNVAELTITDNDVVPPMTNPIDDPAFFVRQHYLDFFNREPDAAAAALIAQLSACGSDTGCILTRRREISTAFFLSSEFQRTGYLAYLTHRAAFGPNASGSPAPILYGNFERDLQALQRGYVSGQPGADAVLEANKVAYFNEFVTRPEFVSKYPSTLTNQQFVDNLLASAGLSPSQVRVFVVSLTNSQEVPPAVPTLTTGGARPASSGTARFQFNDAQTALSFTATISNIDVTGSQTLDTNDNLTAAHIHAGPSVAPGVNGPVVWGFFGAPFNDNNPNDQFFFANPGVGGTFGGKWDAPEGNGTTLAAQLNNLREGRAYINFHTRQFGGGEIRGNFPAATAFRDTLAAGLNAATDTRATILRKVAEAEELQSREFNAASVAMAYFAYYRRDPDTAGFNFLLNRINAFGGDFNLVNLVNVFIKSPEYRQRFGPDSVPFANNAPVANSDAATTNALTPIVIDVLANDTDPDGDFLTIQSVTPGSGGTVKISPDRRSIVFTPTPGFAGTANFQYTVADNGFGCSNPSGCAPSGFTYSTLTATTNVTVTVNSAGTFQFNASTATVGEGAGKITLTVSLAGGSTSPVTVEYATAPDAAIFNCSTVNGQASDRCDYNTAIGVLRFAPGETSKTFDVFITDDSRVEGGETFAVALSNPAGANFTLGGTTTLTVTITDNDATAGPNPIDGAPFFVRQHYIDFLNREPDAGGFNDWINTLNNCPAGNQTCDRVQVSSAFFRSDEFQARGFFAMRFYRAAFGRDPSYREFVGDLGRLNGSTPAESAALKTTFANEFVQRAEFHATLDALTNAQFVDALISNTGVTFTTAQRDQFVADLNSSAKTAGPTPGASTTGSRS